MADISKITIETGTYDIKDETARNNISNVSTNLNNLRNEMITNNQTVNSLIVISDSYGVGVSYPSDTTNFGEYLKNQFGLTNDTYYNNSYGGVGFAYENNSKRFITLVEECNTNLTTERKNGVTHVLFAGGYNDQYSNELDIRNYVIATINRTHEIFPNAQIFVAFIGWNTNGTDFNDTYRAWIEATGLTKYGKFIINSQNILTSDLISTDNIHPIEDGYKKLAFNLSIGLQTGACYPMSPYKYLRDNNDNILGVVEANNNTLTFEMYDLEYTYSGTANGTEINYKTLADLSMLNGKNARIMVPCVFVNSSLSQYVNGYCIWNINNKLIKLKPYALKSDGSNYFDFTSIRFNQAIYNIDHKYI